MDIIIIIIIITIVIWSTLALKVSQLRQNQRQGLNLCQAVNQPYDPCCPIRHVFKGVQWGDVNKMKTTSRYIIVLHLLLLLLLLSLINNDKIISLNRRIKSQFLFNISNELFCFSNKLSEITASIIKLHLHL